MNKRMWLTIAAGALALAPRTRMTGEVETAAEGPRYTADGQLSRPANYREWVWLTSGLGMSYGPLTGKPDADPPFDNVFVNRAAYRGFLESGKWPDKTMFVLEVRSSQGKGSINKGGHFQGGLLGVEVEVKDESRFPGGWAFFGFHEGGETAKAFPHTAACYTCHAQHGAVDNTFVQFYPTLIDVAKQKGTWRGEK